MRWLLALALATGCYRSSPERCSVTFGDPACGSDGGGLDGAPADMMIDGMPSPDFCVLPTSNPSDTAFTNVFGTYFVGVFADDFPAVMLGKDGGGTTAVLEQRGASFAGTFMVVIPQLAGELLAAPRLAPNGLEMFLRIDFTTNSTHAIMRSTRSPQTDQWAAPVGVAMLNGMADSPDAEPSAPTTTDPRRMVVSYSTRAIEEYVEVNHDGNTWTLIRRIDNPTFGLPNYSGQATLTADGRFLVVRAKNPTTNLNTAYTVARDMDGGFNNVGVQVPTAAFSINQPYFAPDCKHLFYSENGQPEQVHMATYP